LTAEEEDEGVVLATGVADIGELLPNLLTENSLFPAAWKNGFQ